MVDEVVINDDKEDEEDKNGYSPCVGMDFDSEDDAYNFYNCYAGRIGFSVRKSSTYRSRITKEITGRTFCCSLQGLRDSRSKFFEERLRNAADSRTGCKAMMTIRKNKEKWVVTIVVEAHNHILVTPSKRYLLRSQRKMEPIQKKIADDMRSVGIRTSLMVDFLASEAGGIQNVGFTRKDVNNYLAAKRQKELLVGDAQALLDHLQQQQLDNPSFSYSIQVDSEGRMTNFFWADARSRMDYHYFGDVVCFDPTYGTNRYDMPFVPIVGVNHHSQTVLFGGALLYSETEESFEWVLRTWMNAMNDKQPKVILTDQESAIGGAIARVLPESRHRFCVWHINRNALKHLAHEINKHKDFLGDLNYCLYQYETVEEFEHGWNKMLEAYKLKDNKWLETLFGKRERWASVYARDIFCAGMYTTQRSESINSYFDKYLKKSLPLYEFMKQYERAVVDRREEENMADYDTNYHRPVLRVFMDIEKEGAKVYTKTMFYKFQEQLFKGLSYRHKKVEGNETRSIYNVWKEGHEEVARTIMFEPSTKSAKCSCQLFEFGGYLCRHILKVFMVEDVQKLPDQYVLKRWTKDAKFGSVVCSESKSNQVKLEESVTSRYCGICQEGVNIASKASPYIEVFNVAKKGLARTLREVEMALKNLALESDHVQDERVASDRNGEINATCVQKPLLDPPIKKHKGRNPGRKLPWIEKGKKKKKVRMETFGGRKRKQSGQTEKSTTNNRTSNKLRLECIDEEFSELNDETRFGEAELKNSGLTSAPSDQTRNFMLSSRCSTDQFLYPLSANHLSTNANLLHRPSIQRNLQTHVSQDSNVVIERPYAYTYGFQVPLSNQVSFMNRLEHSPNVTNGYQPYHLSQESFFVGENFHGLQHEATSTNGIHEVGEGIVSNGFENSYQAQGTVHTDLNNFSCFK